MNTTAGSRMKAASKPGDTIEFPMEWQGRVMARSDAENVPGDIRTALQDLGICALPRRNRTSAGGTYVSYTVSAVIDDRPTLHDVTAALAAIDGVKMVL